MSVRRTVLVVEDDSDLRRLYRLALVFDGFDVREAADGFSALASIDSDPPDLVVLDLMLPTVSGYIVRQEIAASVATRHIPIVIVTGTDGDHDTLDVPCVLRKPVSPARLVSAVQQCIVAGNGIRQ